MPWPGSCAQVDRNRRTALVEAAVVWSTVAMMESTRNSNDRPSKVEDLMTYEPLSLKPSESVDRARDLMLAFGIHGIPIIDDDSGLLGIVTSHDLVDDWPANEPLQNVMSGAVLTIDIRAGLAEAAELMKTRLVHHLVVTDGLEPVGVLTTYDLLDALIGTNRE